MSATGRTRSRSIRESFSKLRRQLSVRRNSKDSVLSGEVLSGIEVWDHSEHSSDESTESYSTSYNSSHTELSDDVGLENFLMPSRTLDSVTEDQILTTPLADLNVADQPFDDMPQSFRFLDLPLEIRRLVYKHYFPPREAKIRMKKSDPASETIISNPWQESQAILLTCREVYETAKEYSRVSAFTLDLSQYAVRSGDSLPVYNIASNLGQVAKKCTRIIVSFDQIWSVSEPALFPSLRTLEIWNYRTWRSLFSMTDPYRLAADFEKESQTLLKRGIPGILAEQRTKLSAGVALQINLACDLLVCVGSDETHPKMDKLRHIFRFSDDCVDGKLIRMWARDHSDMGRLPLSCQMAQHMHLYCLHLREHEPGLIDWAPG